MKLLKNILSVLLAVLATLTGLIVLVVMVWIPFDSNASSALMNRFSDPLSALLICAFALVLIGASVGLIVVMFFAKRMSRNVLIRQGEGGMSFMTVSALTSMVQRYVGSQGFSEDCRISVKNEKSGVSVYVRISARPDAVLPSVTEKLQEDVKTYLEYHTGVHVEKVEIVVESIARQPETAKVQ